MTQTPTLTKELFGRLTDQDVYRPSAGASTTPGALLSEDYSSPNPIRCAVPGGDLGDLVVSLEGDAPAWLEPTTRALADLLWLPVGWDSYGACKVERAHVCAMLEILGHVMRDDTPIPSVAPTNRGGVQVEWHERGIDLEIETLSTHRFRASFEDSATGIAWDREIGADLVPLIESIAVLSGR